MPQDSRKLPRIASLWIGSKLSWVERASINSFVTKGHDYTLYTYGPVENIPEGARAADAREIWDAERVLRYTKSQSPAIHANIFRVRMARLTGEIWADTDIIALRPFAADLRYFIGHERDDIIQLSNAVFGLPESSPLLERLHTFLTSDYPVPPWLGRKRRETLEASAAAGEPIDIEGMPWGTLGPKALTHFAVETGEVAHAQPMATFFPVSFPDRKHLIDAEQGEQLAEKFDLQGTYGVHLYARWIRKRLQVAKGGTPPAHSWIGNYLAENEILKPDEFGT